MSTKIISVSEDFPDRVRKLIEEKNIKKGVLAKQVGVGASSITQIIKGESGVSRRTIKSLSEAFSVSEEWLRFGTGEKHSEAAVWLPTQIHQSLTPEEDQLLKYFRQLSVDRKLSATEIIRGLVLLEYQKGGNSV